MGRPCKNQTETDKGIHLVYLDEDGKLTVHRFDTLISSLQFIAERRLGKQDYILIEGELIRGQTLSDKLKAKRVHDGDAVYATRQMLTRGPMLPDDTYDDMMEDDNEDQT